MDSFTLTRRSDGLVYRFARDPRAVRCYRRADRPDLTVVWEARLGWIMRDPQTGALVGRTWEMPVAEQGMCPPEGPWVTAKGRKSYIYDLSHADTDEREEA
ncbi:MULTISPECIES: hypothetical protein [Roseobacteraceae]|uniref:hypothetical protein n=1 Tax=Roseobacteraceae TaxID=2854170 RepID=UPI001C4545EE|nr:MULTISPECIES: hypothetical protein [Roseobacteraceae]MBV7408974.1 hypothetical protein [Maritimibacter sp. DP1N21-5]MBY5934339.1 hypothetical protein [Tateyamaria omphalii]